jgi:class 3 adenylate cyclase
VTDRVIDAIEGRQDLAFEPIGEVSLRGFPALTPLFVVRNAVL